MDVINLNQKLARFSEYWSPKIIAEVNDMHVKLVKFTGEFVWHHHEKEDELFFVIQGRLNVPFQCSSEYDQALTPLYPDARICSVPRGRTVRFAMGFSCRDDDDAD